MPLLTILIKQYSVSDLHLDQEELQPLPPASAVSSGPSTASVMVEDWPCSSEAILWWTSSGLLGLCPNAAEQLQVLVFPPQFSTVTLFSW